MFFVFKPRIEKYCSVEKSIPKSYEKANFVKRNSIKALKPFSIELNKFKLTIFTPWYNKFWHLSFLSNFINDPHIFFESWSEFNDLFSDSKIFVFWKKNIFTFFAIRSWSRDFLAIRNEVSSHLRYLYEGESQSLEKTNNRQKSR